MFEVPYDKNCAPKPTFKLNDIYCYTQLPILPFNTKNPITIEELEDILQILKSLEQTTKNLQVRGVTKVFHINTCACF